MKRINLNDGIRVSSVLHKNNNKKDVLHDNNNKRDIKKRLFERFKSDRKVLETWASIPQENNHWTRMPLFSEFIAYSVKIGGAEGISLKLQNILLDIDNDGNITEEELKHSEEKRNETVNQALSLLTTAGVVGALLASIMTPLVLPTILNLTHLKFIGIRRIQ